MEKRKQLEDMWSQRILEIKSASGVDITLTYQGLILNYVSIFANNVKVDGMNEELVNTYLVGMLTGLEIGKGK